MSLLIERAKLVAKMVHLEETRRGGELYFVHCENVACSVKDEKENVICAAYLHDVLENATNPNTIRKLMLDYFPEEVSHLVETLTNDKNTQYQRYIDVVCNNPKALLIKLSDMIDNTKDIIPEKQKAKYRETCIQMIGRRIEVPKILKERLNIEEK